MITTTTYFIHIPDIGWRIYMQQVHRIMGKFLFNPQWTNDKRRLFDMLCNNPAPFQLLYRFS